MYAFLSTLSSMVSRSSVSRHHGPSPFYLRFLLMPRQSAGTWESQMNGRGLFGTVGYYYEHCLQAYLETFMCFLHILGAVVHVAGG